MRVSTKPNFSVIVMYIFKLTIYWIDVNKKWLSSLTNITMKIF